MRKDKRGLSGIVTTLIIILLVLVSVGVIWGVVSGLLNKSTGTIQTSSKCLDIDMKAVKLVQAGAGADDYNVTISRTSTGEDIGFGAKLMFFNDNTNSDPIDFGESLTPMGLKTMNVPGTGIANATKIRVTPYFTDDSGREVLCPSSTEFQI